MSEAWEKDGLGIYLFALVLAGIVFAHSLIYAKNSPIGVPPDEWAHVTHINEVAVEGRLLPDYAGSKILYSGKGNYLGHPPLYYTGLGLMGRALGLDAVHDVVAYRFVSAALVAFGLLLWVLIARQIGLAWYWMVPIFLSVNAIPMFPYLAGSVNNDTLAYLAVAMSVFGVATASRYPRASYYWMAIGLLAAILTKMTAGLFLIGFLGIWFGLNFSNKGLFRSKHLLAAVGLVVVIGGSYYLYTLLEFGTLFPRAGEAHSRNGLPADPLTFGGVAKQSFLDMVSRLSAITSHAPTNVVTGRLHDLFLIGLTIPLVALACLPFVRARMPVDSIVFAFSAALALNMFVHLAVVWRGYQVYGVLAGLQPRYYSFVLPGLFVLSLAAYRRSRAVSVLLAVFSVVWMILSVVVPGRSLKAETSKFDATSHLEAGFVDGSALVAGKVEISGWAIDAASADPAVAVEIYYRERLLARGATGMPRPDVAASLHDPDAGRSGFRIRVQGVPANVNACELVVAARQADKQLARLRRSDCKAR